MDAQRKIEELRKRVVDEAKLLTLSDAEWLLAHVQELRGALKFANEIITDQAKRFHKDCRCQLCESWPMEYERVLKGEITNVRQEHAGSKEDRTRVSHQH